ncbi:MAG TPA: tetratricopeptide repeat protein [Novosphingobium sp.]
MTARLLAAGSLARRALLLAGAAAAVSLTAGCAGSSAPKSASAKPARPATKPDQAVARAELAVQREPKNAAARAALGQAYLAAGRFQSATTAFDDAMALGDNSGRTALALALAKIGSGREREAIALLDDWRSEIPASDLGLALALAGDAGRGATILADALRSGDSTPKLRQNLAYAYALDGRWSEARLMAAQDVPAAELDQRLAMWALSALPDRNQDRVAGLIGAPLRTDPGQPAALALNVDRPAEQLAVQSAPLPSPGVSAPEPTAAAAASELPPVASAAKPSVLEQNLMAQAQPAPAQPVRVRSGTPRPSVATAFADTARLPRAVRAAPAGLARKVPATVKVASGGTHLVQLGSFASPQGARRAWGIFVKRSPGLAGYRMAITPATVNGRQFWRVAAAGLVGRDAALGLCSQVKAHGGACFAYAAPVLTTVPRVLTPGRDVSGPQRARR